MSFRYSQLFGTASEALGAVITPGADKDRQPQRVSNFKNINQFNSLKIKIFNPLLKFETLGLEKI
jgi:hypothetical protein